MGLWARKRRGQDERPGTKREKMVQRVLETVQEGGATIVDRETLRTVDNRVNRSGPRPKRSGSARSSWGPIVDQARGTLFGIAGRASISMRHSLELRMLASRIAHDLERFERKCEEQLTVLRGASGNQQPAIGGAMLVLYQIQRELEAWVESYRAEAIQAENNANAALATGMGPASSGGPTPGAGAHVSVNHHQVEDFLDSGELKALKIAAAAPWSKTHTRALSKKATAVFERSLEQARAVRERATSAGQPYPTDIAALIDHLRTVNEQMKADVRALQTPERPRKLFGIFVL